MLYYGLLVSFVLEYVRPGTYLPLINALKLNAAVPILVFVLALYVQRQNANADILAHRNSKWLAFFMGLLALSVLRADVTLYSFNIFKTILGYVFLYFVVAKLLDDYKKLNGLILTLLLCHVVLLILNPVVITNPETRSYIEGVTFLGDGNDFSLSIVLLIPLGLHFLLNATYKNLYKVSILVVIGALMLGVIGTSSRGGFIAAIAVVCYLWWRGRSKGRGSLVVLALVLAVYSYAPPVFFERMDTIRTYEEDGSAVGRIMAWNSAIRMANDNPLRGVGSGHFSVKLGTEYQPPEYEFQNLPWLTAHSVYFLALGELGYPGLFFVLAILYFNIRSGERIIKKVRQSPSKLARRYESLFLHMNASLIGFAVGGAFLSALYYPHLYVISGIYVAAELMYRRDEARILSDEATDETRELLTRGGQPSDP
jgi:probable O-glycosylation ligase (exosortase A-associated)